MPSLCRFKTSHLTEQLAIDGLNRGYEFVVDNSLDVEKTINMDLTLL
jgi:hypothetical protein